METTSIQTVIGSDGKLRIEIPCHLPPGPAQVTVTVEQAPPKPVLRWRDYYGVGQELWGSEDAQDYVNRLRDEWQNASA